MRGGAVTGTIVNNSLNRDILELGAGSGTVTNVANFGTIVFDAGANWTFGNFSDVQTNGTNVGTRLNATSTRVMVGVAVYPFGHWR